MLPTSMPLRRMTGCPQVGTGIALLGVGDVGDHVGLVVAPDVDVAQVVALAVGARDQVRRAGDEVVDHDDRAVGADRRAVARLHPRGLDLLDRRRSDAAGRARRVHQLGLVDLVVAAHDGGQQPPVAGDEERGLGGPRRVDPEERRERRDGRRAGRGDLLEGERLLRRGLGPRDDRDLPVRGVAARLAQDEDVLAGRVQDHELVRQAAAHHADVGADRDRVEAEALEDPHVRPVLRPVAGVEAGLVAVAAVGVLHDELADADQPAARARLVAPFRLEVVDLHRRAGDTTSRCRRGARPTTSSWVIARTMSRPLRSLNRPSSGPMASYRPLARHTSAGMDDRHLHLLRADPVLLLADDLLDAVVDPLAQGQQRIDARPELADVAGALQQAMRGHLRIGGVVAERGEEQVGESHGRQG